MSSYLSDSTLAQHFVERFAREFGRPVIGLSREARDCIEAHPWPGNIRELEHTIERGVLLAPANEVRAADLCLPGATAPNAIEAFNTAKARAVEQFERRYIEHLLAVCDGNVTHAADAASKNRRAFWELMRKHGIDAKRFRGLPQR